MADFFEKTENEKLRIFYLIGAIRGTTYRMIQNSTSEEIRSLVNELEILAQKHIKIF